MLLLNQQKQPPGLRILIAITGASGSIYAQRLVEVLLGCVDRIYLLFSPSGKKVVEYELKKKKTGFCLVRAAQGKLLDNEKQVIRLF